MIKHTASHLDHHLSPAQVAYILGEFASRESFFIETITMPSDLGTVLCGLYGRTATPEYDVYAGGRGDIMGNGRTFAPIHDGARGTRAWKSRLVDLPMYESMDVTVIGGPHEGACILYTAYGGVAAPQEPGDPACKDVEESRRFWNTHALSSLAPGRRGVLTGRAPAGCAGKPVRVEDSGRITYRLHDGLGDTSTYVLLPECLWSCVEWSRT